MSSSVRSKELSGTSFEDMGVRRKQLTSESSVYDYDETGEAEDAVADNMGAYASVEDMLAHHERQITTLVEMHSEVLDLNSHLQSALLLKTRQIGMV